MGIGVSVTRFFTKSKKYEYESLLKSQVGCCLKCGIDIKRHGRKEVNKDGECSILCSLCYFSNHLEFLSSTDDGTMIMVSALSQVDVIALSRAIELIKRLDSKIFDDDIDSALIIRMLMEEGSNNAEYYFAEGSSDIEMFAQVLINQPNSDYEVRDSGFYNMRWLPNYKSFKVEMDYWFDILMKDKSSIYHPSKWEDMAQKINKKINKQ